MGPPQGVTAPSSRCPLIPHPAVPIPLPCPLGPCGIPKPPARRWDRPLRRHPPTPALGTVALTWPEATVPWGWRWRRRKRRQGRGRCQEVWEFGRGDDCGKGKKNENPARFWVGFSLKALFWPQISEFGSSSSSCRRWGGDGAVGMLQPRSGRIPSCPHQCPPISVP